MENYRLSVEKIMSSGYGLLRLDFFTVDLLRRIDAFTVDCRTGGNS